MPAPIRGFHNKQMLTWTEQSGYTCLLEKFQAQQGAPQGTRYIRIRLSLVLIT